MVRVDPVRNEMTALPLYSFQLTMSSRVLSVGFLCFMYTLHEHAARLLLIRYA